MDAPSFVGGLLPEGFRDRLPPQAEAGATLLRTIIDVVAAHGYERVQPPLAEFEPSLGRWLGKPAGGALLRATDPASGQGLALRPDITGQVARIAATRMAALPRPLRLAYGGPVLRAKGGQLNAAREFTQAGAELIGSDSVAAVAEVLTTAVEALRAAGVTELSVDLTLPDLVGELSARIGLPGGSSLEALQAALDGKDSGGLKTLGAEAYAPLLAATGPAEQALKRLRDMAPAALLDRVADLVASLGDVSVTIDPTERHGFEYQSWIGFSLFGAGPNGQVRGEIGRGGSYVVRHEDGRQEAAVGFSLYVDSLVDAGLGLSAARRIFLPIGTDAGVGARLRGEGWATVAALSDADAGAGCSHRWDGARAVPA